MSVLLEVPKTETEYSVLAQILSFCLAEPLVLGLKAPLRFNKRFQRTQIGPMCNVEEVTEGERPEVTSTAAPGETHLFFLWRLYGSLLAPLAVLL